MPLFPLNTVLFPGMPLQLHIFEERYKRMINECNEHKRPFGVVLIKEGSEALGPLPMPHWIGTAAYIQELQRLPDGRMNILVSGGERIRILSIEHDLQPYLLGYVESFPFDDHGLQINSEVQVNLRIHLNEYIDILARSGITHLDVDQFPNDPVALAFLSAALLPISNQQKQEVLAIEKESSLLKFVDSLFRREIPLLREIVMKQEDNGTVFSRN